MERAVAQTVVRGTRDEAEQAARTDLSELRRRALDAGRERSRELIKVTRFGADGSIRHNPAGRVLRDWYVHAYMNGLRASLGLPHEPVDAQQTEETAALLRRLQPDSEPLRTLQAAGTVRKRADADAAEAVVHIVDALRGGAIERAIRHAADERFDGDDLRVHVTRHWYQRCYDTTVDEMVGARHPLAALTAGEEAEVARTLATGEVRRLIGRDGIPLVTAHQTVINDLDRRLAAGETGLVPPSIVEVRNHDGFKPLEQRVRADWMSVDRKVRGEWLFLAGALPLPDHFSWNQLSEEQQTRLVGHYLKTHRLELLGQDFDRPILRGDSADVARRMFNHRAPLVAEGAKSAAEARGAGFEAVESADRSIESSRGLTR